MTPFKFYDLFVTIVETFPVVPIFLGLRRWKLLSVGMIFFLGFFMADLILNKIGDYYYYVLRRNNLFLHYYYSLFQGCFILLSFFHFFKQKIEKLIVLFLAALCILLILVDFLYISGIDFNYISGPSIDLIIFCVSIFYFSNNIIDSNVKFSITKEFYLKISLILSLQFFIKFIDAFLEKYLLEAQNNAFLWLQVKDIYYYFMLFCLVMYSYIMYNIKNYEV